MTATRRLKPLRAEERITERRLPGFAKKFWGSRYTIYFNVGKLRINIFAPVGMVLLSVLEGAGGFFAISKTHCHFVPPLLQIEVSASVFAPFCKGG